jgi:nuclear pore complex protein Nup160
VQAETDQVLELPTDFHLDHEAVVALFSQTGAYDQAFSAGRVLGVDLSSLFETVAERCVALSLHPEGCVVLPPSSESPGWADEFSYFPSYSSQDASWVTLSDEAATWSGSLSSKAWRLLENHLSRHDVSPSYPYRLVVLERTLATNRGGKVPAFLTEYLAERNVHALLRTLIKYDRLDEAVTQSLATIKVRIPLLPFPSFFLLTTVFL